jgi:hypothetical protein
VAVVKTNVVNISDRLAKIEKTIAKRGFGVAARSARCGDLRHQYQQQPVAPGGAMIKHAWVRRYDQLPKSGRIIQSWDVAHKQGEKTIVAISGNGSISF